MRILYVSQYFPPEMGAPSARVHELSRAWARQGHQVTVLTGFAHHPTGKKAPQDCWRVTRREPKDGIDVIRAYVYATSNAGIVRRMVSYASFMISAAMIGAVRAPRPDVVLATSPQLLCACAGYLLARRFRCPFVFEVRDLWPESILAVEAMRENFIVRGLKRVADFLYRRADRIVTVGRGYKRAIMERYAIAENRFDIVPNGIDRQLFVPRPQDNEVRREYGWADRFVVLYAGTLGMAHGLETTLLAAQELRNAPNVLFVLLGEGAEKKMLKEKADTLGLSNVQFIDQQPKARMPLFYAACDVGLVTLRKSPLFQEVLPSKIFEYLGMERAILLSVDGEARQLVEEAQAGRYVPPEDVASLVAAIRWSMEHRSELKDMGIRGREHVLRYYDRHVLAERYLGILGQLVTPSGVKHG